MSWTCQLPFCGLEYQTQAGFHRHIAEHEKFHDGPAHPRGCCGPHVRNRTFNSMVKWMVFRRDGGRCVRCGATVTASWENGNTYHDCEVHHIVARAKGGANCMANLVLLCLDCHRGNLSRTSHGLAQGATTLEDFLAATLLPPAPGPVPGPPLGPPGSPSADRNGGT